MKHVMNVAEKKCNCDCSHDKGNSVLDDSRNSKENLEKYYKTRIVFIEISTVILYNIS